MVSVYDRIYVLTLEEHAYDVRKRGLLWIKTEKK